MELLVQYGVSLTLTRWLVAALQERKVAIRLGNWISTPQQLTMGLPQGSLLSPFLDNVYTRVTGGSEQQWFACGRRACLQSKHMRYPLDLPSMEAKHKAQQVKAYLSAMHSPKNPLLDAVKEKKGCRLARDKSWMGKAKQSIQHKQARDWEKHPVEFKPYYKTQLSDLGVGDHVSSGLVDSFHFAGCNFALQRLGHGLGLALVCECWYEDGVYDFGVYDFALCVYFYIRMF